MSTETQEDNIIKDSSQLHKVETRVDPNKTSVSMMMSISGPLPPPQVVKAYEECYPGAAKIIFDIFQKQVSHRHEMDSRNMANIESKTKTNNETINKEMNERKRGQSFAVVITMTLLILTASLLALDKKLSGSIFGTASAAAIVCALLKRKTPIL